MRSPFAVPLGGRRGVPERAAPNRHASIPEVPVGGTVRLRRDGVAPPAGYRRDCVVEAHGFALMGLEAELRALSSAAVVPNSCACP